ncbi:MAG: FAD-dependent oxidoreductase [Ahrensia sp.]
MASPIAGDLKADLVVIGGGFTGCSAALDAARQGASVVLLEANAIGFGGSGRNVGLVNAGLWMPPDRLIEQMGEAQAMRLIEQLGVGPAQVFDLIGRENIACEARRAGTLHLAHAPSGLDDLRERFAQGNRFGAPLQLLDAAETQARVGTSAYCGALYDPRAGTVQPLGYCVGLARAAQQHGAQLHERSAVSSVQFDNGLWHVKSNGYEVTVGALLMATNAYHQAIEGPEKPRFSVLHYSQVATAPLTDEMCADILPGGQGCWDTAMVMSSLRLDASGRLIFGFMGQSDGLGGPVHLAWARREIARLFPALSDISFGHSWQGRIAVTHDKIPKVVALGPNAYAIYGYSGRGIAPGTVFGTAAAKALLDNEPGAFPLDVSQHHGDRYTGLKSLYFEFGATLSHAVAAR